MLLTPASSIGLSASLTLPFSHLNTQVNYPRPWNCYRRRLSFIPTLTSYGWWAVRSSCRRIDSTPRETLSTPASRSVPIPSPFGFSLRGSSRSTNSSPRPGDYGGAIPCMIERTWILFSRHHTILLLNLFNSHLLNCKYIFCLKRTRKLLVPCNPLERGSTVHVLVPLRSLFHSFCLHFSVFQSSSFWILSPFSFLGCGGGNEWDSFS